MHGFIHNNPIINGSSYSMLNNGNALITVTSAAVEKLSYDELIYLFGHELGHFFFPHYDVRNDAAGEIASVEDAHYSRQMEIFMDRIGLVACRNVTFATSATLKVASGLGSEHIMANIPAYSAEALKGFGMLPEDSELLHTHPPIYIRIRSLMLFAGSDAYATYQGREGGRPIAEVNAEIENDLMSTGGRYAEKKVMECLSRLPAHLFAYSNVTNLGLGHEAFLADGVPIHEEEFQKAAAHYGKGAESKREEKFHRCICDLMANAIKLCPRRMAKYVDALSAKAKGTPLEPLIQFGAEALIQLHKRHIEEESLFT